MISEIFKIRLKQLIRIIAEIGIIRTVVLFLILGFSLILMYTKLNEESYREIVILSFAAIILLIHFKRKDKEFVNIYIGNPRILFFVEYLIISFPLIIAILYLELWIYAAAYLGSLIIIAIIKLKEKKLSINSLIQRLIPEENFEWKSGIRRNLFFAVGVWLIGFFTSFFIGSVPIVIFILGVIVLNFYEKFEPLAILIANEYNPREFLFRKLQNHLIIFSVLISPLILSFLIFSPQYYYIPLIEFISFCILIVYTILLKYSFYRPEGISGATQIFTMIGIACLFIPVLIPIILLLSIKFLFKAINNLNYYLDDFN